MPAPAARTYYVITTRGDVGPYTRAELREQLQSGAVRSTDQVRNAFGRPLGTVAEAMSDASSARTPAHAGPPVPDPPSPQTLRRRSPAPLIIGLVAAALVAAAVFVATSSAPATAPAAPTMPQSTTPAPPTPAPPADSGLPSATQPTASLQNDALPDGWSLLDLGDARPKGKATFADGLWTIDGGGEDIWGKRDECAFVHREASGDFSMVVRVVSMQDTNQWDKIGMMVRASLDATAPMAALTVTHGGTVQFMLRRQDKAAVDGIGSAKVKLPVWLQLTRRGKTFAGYWSDDGTTWTGVGSKQDVGTLPATTRLGLAVCSHNRSVANRAVFSDLSVTAPR